MKKFFSVRFNIILSELIYQKILNQVLIFKVITNHSSLISSIIIYVLCTLVVILLLLVIILLIKSIHKIPNETSSGRCTLLASSALDEPKQQPFKYEISDRQAVHSHKKYEQFSRNPSEKGTSAHIHPNGKHVHSAVNDYHHVHSPLLANNTGSVKGKQLITNSSDISDSFNDDNSKSTLFTCSIDESNTNSKLPMSLNKQNPISIYYC